jgi:hypothetical protein
VPLDVPETHAVFPDRRIKPPFPDDLRTAVLALGWDPARVSYETLLKVFWEGHDPTQRMRQGNDVGTRYRSGIYYTYYTYYTDDTEDAEVVLMSLPILSGVGRLTAVPELRFTASGTAVCTVNLAFNAPGRRTSRPAHGRTAMCCSSAGPRSRSTPRTSPSR